MSSEKRSAARDSSTPDLFGWEEDAPAVVQPGPVRPGVGGRQARPRPAGGGGGYLDGRSISKVPEDIRLRELQAIGLSRVWLNVAEIVGYDKFLEMWGYLDSEPELRNHRNQIQVVLRQFASFKRYQRNRFVETMVASGMNTRMVRAMVLSELGERLTDRQMRNLFSAARVRP